MTLKYHNLLPLLFIFVVSHVCALFEDQAFRFDWRQQYVGHVKNLEFWEASAGSGVILRTDSNVLALVDADSGNIKWRHIFADSIILESSLDAIDGKYVSTISRSLESDNDFTLSVWNVENGVLSAENRITNTLGYFHSAFVSLGKFGNLVNVSPEGAVKIYSYDMKKGNLVDSYSYSTGASDVSCINLNSVFICLAPSLKLAYYTSLPFVKGGSFNAIPLSSLINPSDNPATVVRTTKNKATISLNNKDSLVLSFDSAGKFVNSNVMRGTNPRANYFVAGCKNTDDLILIEQECGDKASSSGCATFGRQLKISMLDLPHQTTFKAKFERGRLTNAWASCDPTASAASEPNYQLVLQFEDSSITSVTPLGNLMWSREEALADIAAIQLVSMGLHVNDGSNDNDELSSLDLAGSIYGGSHERDILAQFGHRLKHHAFQLQSTIAHLLAVKDLGFLFQSKDTSVDDFGIRKVIVAATKYGKVYGIDSITGKVLWHILFSGKPFKNLPESLYLFVQRSSYHYGLEARCTLIYVNSATSLPELIHFNPLNGKVVGSRKLSRNLLQACLLHHTGEDHIKAIMMVTEGYAVEMAPASAPKHLTALSGKMFLAVMDQNGDRLQGNRLTLTKEGEVTMSPIWTFTSPGAKILRLVSKPTDEIVHSQGRVMADRSVLFKYINPNLGFILTEGKDAAAKSFINVYLIDLVTGRIVFSASHKRVLGPYHIVHSENWSVYTYYNEKARRAELISLEMFEGTTQNNATVFSSLHSKVLPLVERQAFILGPTYVTAMKDTVTDKGITSKHLLMATTAGAIYDVSRHYLDPRRPNMNTPVEMREPGLPPYIPELQFPPEVVLNYNQSVAQPRGISTAPTDLESTSVIFAYGLDLFCTRVTPSKGFDLLKDDFDYSIIAAVLFALVAASVASRKFSQMKNLKSAWR